MKALEARHQLQRHFPDEYTAYCRLAALLRSQDIPSRHKGRITEALRGFLALPAQRLLK